MLQGSGEGSGSLLGISWTDDIQTRNRTECCNGLDRFVGRTILADGYRVVGEDIGGGKFGKRSHTDGRTPVIAEDQEGRAGDAEDTVVGIAIHNRAHGVLADTEVDVATLVVLKGEIPSPLDVVERGTEEIGATANQERHRLGNRLKCDAPGFTCGNRLVLLERRNDGQKIGDGLIHTAVEQSGKFLVGGAPGGVLLLPDGMGLGTLRLEVREVGGDFGRDVELLLRKTESLAGLIGELHSGLAVSLVRSFDLRNPFSDHCFADDHVRLALGRLGLVEGREDLVHVVSVDHLNMPTVGGITGADILALADIQHRVEGDVIGIKEDDQVVDTKVTGQ